MALASRFLKGLIKRSTTRLVSKVGGKLVSRIADTSADAPAAAYEPKRDVYEAMTRPQPAAPPAPTAPTEPDADDRGHEHSHGHSHGHDHSHDH